METEANVAPPVAVKSQLPLRVVAEGKAPLLIVPVTDAELATRSWSTRSMELQPVKLPVMLRTSPACTPDKAAPENWLPEVQLASLLVKVVEA